MKLYLFSILLFFSTFAFPQKNDQLLKARIDSLLSDNFFNSTQIAVDAFDLTSKKLLFKKNEDLLLNPASNLKLLTTITALKYLGDSYKFTTGVYYTGGILNGTLYGNLYIKGGCDPDFSTADLDSLVSEVKNAGIKNITGSLFGDVTMMDSLFWGKGWMWDDDPSTDAPYLTPLNINKNSFGVILKPTEINSPPEVIKVPETGYFKIKNDAVTVPVDSPETVKIDRNWIKRENTIVIKGDLRNISIPDSLTDTLSVNIFRPDLYFLNLFKERLLKDSVIFTGKITLASVPDYANNIYNFKRPLVKTIPEINKDSYNLGAEMLLYALAAKYYGLPATASNGILVEDSLLCSAGLDPGLYRIVDGSGVSRYNLVSVDMITSLLKYIYYDEPVIYKEIYSSLPIAGIDGTLKQRMNGTPAENNVRAKTGTLGGVTTLSGYLTSKEGHDIVFSIMIENYVESPDTGRYFQNKICNLLIGY